MGDSLIPYGEVNDTLTPTRRSTRTASIPTNIPKTRPYKRKRTDSTTQVRSEAKKQKQIATKARVDVRVDRDAASQRWFNTYAALFKPLLPETSTFFSKYSSENNMPPCIPREEIYVQPESIQGEMKDYQLKGLSFLTWMYKNGVNCILGDEMGLGKTLQTLSLFAYVAENAKRAVSPHLVICPLSVLSSWQGEAAKWLPSFRVGAYHGSKVERDRFKNAYQEANFDLIITTYETFATEHKWFKHGRSWTYCVLDEGHRIKCADTQIRQHVDGLGAMYRLILTGTPLQNNLVELWSLLHWLYPTVFTLASQRLFENSFNMTEGKYDLNFLQHTGNLLSLIMLRRTKDVVEINLPEREEHTVFLPLSESQRFWTYRLLTSMHQVDLEKVFGTKGPVNGREDVVSALEKHNKLPMDSPRGTEYKRLKNLLMQLRQVCNHPYLLDDALPEPYRIGEHVVSSSIKIMAIDKLLKEILPKGERVLIFSQFTGMLDVLEDFLQLRSIRYARLDGSTPRQRRTVDIKLFQREDSPFQVFLISTRAGGLGINLTKASTVVMCDTDWNPQNDLQAIARAHRIGQTKTVKVYRLICRATVEDQMLDRVRRKMFLSVKVMSDNNSDSSTKGERIGTMEMLKILRNGSSALTSTDDGMSLAQFLDASFEEVVRVSKKREDLQDAMIKRDCVKKEEEEAEEAVIGAQAAEAAVLADIELAQQQLLSGVAQVKSRLFEGQVIPRSNKEIADEWTDLQKRARKDKLIHIGGMAFAPEPTITTITSRPPPKKKEKKEDRQWEDWCIHCRDGGALVMCHSCPRVFHASCSGLKPRELKAATVTCSQHECTMCLSKVSQAGYLFRCRTCPQAFCESCLEMHGEVDYIGDALPEFLLLGHGAKTNSYFVQCCDCKDRLQQDPHERADWEAQFKRDDAEVERVRAENMGLNEEYEQISATPLKAEEIYNHLSLSQTSPLRVKLESISVKTSSPKLPTSKNPYKYGKLLKKEPKLESLDNLLHRKSMVFGQTNSRDMIPPL